MITSCFGNASSGELGSAKALTLNNIKSLASLKGKKIDGGPCTIPGFQPPELPNFQIPTIPLFGGIPPFPSLCFLPPFPGIPALSLPPISIPIPPLPMLPPIPLPIPGFSLPMLPMLPSFDLGSLSFLCGLLKIDLPILDPFAFLNNLLKKLNALIGALNDFLKFCEENQQVIAQTEAPASNSPTAPSPSLTTPNPKALSLNKSLAQASNNDAGGGVGGGTGGNAGGGGTGTGGFALTGSNASISSGGGLNIVQPVETGDFITTASAAPSLTQTLVSASEVLTAFENMNIAADDTADQLAIYLANEGVFPPEPSIINQVASLFSSFGLASEVNPLAAATTLIENNIPSAKGFIGFKTSDIGPILEEAADAKQFVDLLTKAELITSSSDVKEKLFAILTGSDTSSAPGASRPTIKGTINDGIRNQTLSALTIAILLNTSGIPYGKNANSLARVKPLDVARAFFIKHATLPFTPEKILRVLLTTGVVADVGTNAQQALNQLTQLPTSLTPSTIGEALKGIFPGPGIDALKAACIASSRGTKSPQVLNEMNKARANALLQSVRDLKKSTLIQSLAPMPQNVFIRLIKNTEVPLIFPLSVWELIPLLSIVFEVDDQEWYDFLNQFDVPGLFFSLEELFNFISASAKIMQSEANAQRAIATCYDVQESDFDYYGLVNNVTRACEKFNISLPTSASVNRNIANALQAELGYSSISMANALGRDEFNTFDEVTFRLLATGSLVATTAVDPLEQNISLQSRGKSLLSITIKSPSGLADDILQSSIEVEMITKKFTTAGVLDQQYHIVSQGSPTPGSTITLQYNDITQILEINVLRINGFNASFEAVSQIKVRAQYATLVKPDPEQIPNHLIGIKF